LIDKEKNRPEELAQGRAIQYQLDGAVKHWTESPENTTRSGRPVTARKQTSAAMEKKKQET
jgi:hypothetical protein